MATPTYALYATASFHGQVVEESFVRTGEPLQIGNSSALAVPVPRGLQYIARVLWVGPSLCSVRDGLGNVHEISPDQDLQIELGAVSLRLALTEQFRFKRSHRVSAAGSLAWLAVVLITTLIAGQGNLLARNYCLIASVTPLSDCLSRSSGAAGGAYSAEYLARLLQKDFEGEDEGYVELIDNIDRPEAERKTKDDVFMPAGNEGPITKMGGAEDTSRKPVRTDEDDLPLPQQKLVEDKMPLVEVGTPIPIEEPAAEARDGEVDGFDEVEENNDELAVDPPSEEEEGWGIPDWYDEQDQALEELEIELMLHLAQHRLRIDPNDPESLSMLSYYQYLAGDYDAAMQTYNRFIDLYPESAAGYNNKALVFKRRGEYSKEESLYRTALYFQPNDVTAMNNLAVNLAHQGRFEEALAIMNELEVLDPHDPYADLHRAKIQAEIGNTDQALAYLRKALQGMAALDTLHHIEFRQDIRLDPSFARLRETQAFRAILHEFYGDDSPLQE